MAPLGTKCTIFEKKQQRISTWSDHGQHGWYIRPSPQHYRNYNIYVNTTKATQNSDTVTFLPTKFNMPTTLATNRATVAIEELVHESSTPLLATGSPTNVAFRQLTALFEDRSSLADADSPTDQASPRVTQSRSSPADHAPPRVVDEIDQPPRVPPRHKKSQWSDQTTCPTTRASQLKRDLEQQKTHFSNYTEGSGNALQALLSKQDQAEPTFSNYSGGYRNALQALVYEEGSKTKIKNLDHLKELADHHCHAITHHTTGNKIECHDLISDPDYKDVWTHSGANELGRLVQGVANRIKGTNTIFFIHKHQVPKGRTITYAHTVCTI